MLSLRIQAIIALCAVIVNADLFTYKPLNQFSRRRHEFESDSSSEEINEDPQIWAVLVAGSSGWYNYRHQADVCHAFHVLRNHGIPEQNIITMMYDDIARNPYNKYPGKIFNSPLKRDVYAGVKIDYRGDDVNAKNFMSVLLGNSSGVSGGNGRVLGSNENDKVFVYFADHGAPGLLVFPNTILTVQDLTKTLKQMHSRNLYKEMTFYVEACESGSMFENLLPEELEIYAVTAANSHESSYGCFCDTEVDLPCLGDLFSINWLQDSDKENLKRETLEKQYDIVKKLTNMSHVCHFGNEQIWLEHVSEFQGDKDKTVGRWESSAAASPLDYKMWPSRDIPLMQIISERDAETNHKRKNLLTQQIRLIKKGRIHMESEVKSIVERVLHDVNNRERAFTATPSRLHRYMDCHHNVLNVFHQICFNFNKNPYALTYVYVLANLCEMGIESERIIVHLMDHCVALKTDAKIML